MRLARPRTATVLGAVFIVGMMTPAPAATATAPPPPPPPPTIGSHSTSRDDSYQVDAPIGHWTVTAVAPHRYQVTWTSPSPLVLTDARPQVVAPGGRPVGHATFTGRPDSVSITLSAQQPPNPADLHVEMGGQFLDTGATAPVGPAAAIASPRRLVTLAEDPGTMGSHDIVTSRYKLDPVKLPGLALRSEMVGQVVSPLDADASSPLVLFLHGRHQACFTLDPGEVNPMPTVHRGGGNWGCRGKRTAPVPSFLGYDYAQRLLASQGYVTVSISADAINDQDFAVADGGARDRSVLIQRHLDAWVDFVDAGTYSADLSNVVLVGHSRGGEGADRASLDIGAAAPYTITGQVLIGPTDFGFQTAPYTPTVTILPYCDGDVSDLEGQIFTDSARDISADTPALHSSVLVMGANHNFFNTEWTPGLSIAPSFDDWFGKPDKPCGTATPERLSPRGQQRVGKTYIAGAVHLFADGDTAVLPMFDGSAVTVPSANNADVRSHAVGGGLDTRRPGLDAGLSTPIGATTRLCNGKGSIGPGLHVCDPGVDPFKTPHWPFDFGAGIPHRDAFDMAWTAADQEGGLVLDSPWDLSGDSTLDLRTVVDPTLGSVRLGVRLHDATGSTVVTPLGHGRLARLPGGGFVLGKRLAQTLRVPLDTVSGVELSAITEVDLVGRSDDGHVWVLDLSATPTTGLAPLPVRHFPTISLSNVRQPEGDGPDPAIALVPYTIDGTLAADATISLRTMDPFFRPSKPTTVTIPSGSTSGVLPVPYQPNTVDDQRQQIFAAAFPVSGIETSNYTAIVKIIDDDPTPGIKVSAVDHSIREGGTARWHVQVAQPVGYGIGILGRAVVTPHPGRQLAVGDLPPRIRKRLFFPVPPLDKTLSQAHLRIFGFIDPGQTETTIDLPTLHTKHAEGVEEVTLKFRARGFTFPTDTITIRVRDH